MDAYPEDWTTYSIGQIGDPLMCKRILKEQTEESGDVPFYKIGTFGRKADAYISRGLYEDFKSKYSYPKKGDILISAAGTIGRLVVFDGEDAYFQDSNIVWLGNDETIVLNLYLYWAFQNMKWQSEDGGIVSRLYNNNFKAMQLVVPPLPEQRRIAAALGDMDKLIDNLSKRIEKKKAIKQGAMQELLTGKKRLPGFEGCDDEGVVATQDAECVTTAPTPSGSAVGCDDEGVVATQGTECVTTAPTPSEYGGWKKVRLGDCGRWLGGGTPSTHVREYWEGNVPWISSSDITEGDIYTITKTRFVSNVAIRDSKTTICPEGTIHIVARVGVGKIAIATEPTCTSQDYANLLPCGIDTQFAAYLISRMMISKKEDVQGTSIKGLSLEDLKRIVLFVPHSLPEQRAIAKVLGDMDAEIAKLEAKREKLTGIKKGMMSDLLTGKVRLKGGTE